MIMGSFGRYAVETAGDHAQLAAIALIMFSRAARRAGRIPARMPVTAPLVHQLQRHPRPAR